MEQKPLVVDSDSLEGISLRLSHLEMHERERQLRQRDSMNYSIGVFVGALAVFLAWRFR